MSEPVSEPLCRTPLYEEHCRLGARLIPFSGWEMPVQYQSILQEHRAVRESVGMFDVSHMAEFRIRGPAAAAFLQRLTPNNVEAIQPGGSQYSCLLRPHGGIIDDIFIYRLDDSYLIVANAGNHDKVDAWLTAQAPSGVSIVDESATTALIAVQGPAALEAVRSLVDGDLDSLPRRGIRAMRLAGVSAMVSRTGYTGEDGVEIYIASTDAVAVWRTLSEQAARPIQPCGLGARDTLRLEAGNLLYGHDMDETVNPLEAGLGFIVKLDKGDFIGREALLQQRDHGIQRRIAGFEMLDRGVPRADCEVRVSGAAVGRVTSGSYGPTVDRNIGLAYLIPDLAVPGQEVDIIIRDRPARARVVKLPFYRAKKRSTIVIKGA